MRKVKPLPQVSNRATLSNFERLAERIEESEHTPLLTEATLLVPGYVDEEEVGQIARFIAGLSRAIPYSLLALSPDFRDEGPYPQLPGRRH